ncbi:MAG: hypothetical protein ACI9Y1_000472 [Lentisphaeria bacterium]
MARFNGYVCAASVNASIFCGRLKLVAIITLIKPAIKKPLTFHHNHDTCGTNIQSNALLHIPNNKPMETDKPVLLRTNKPKLKTARIGLFASEPILLMASNTVGAISSTKKAMVKVSVPHTIVIKRELANSWHRSQPLLKDGRTNSSMVVALSEFNTELSEDIAEANNATKARPITPLGNWVRI